MEVKSEMASEFSQQFNGTFFGTLEWVDLDALWLRVLAAPEGWYASLAGQPPPVAPLDAEALRRFVGELDALLRREHQEKFCGFVFADDRTQPGFIKIYDPNNLGCSCGTQAGANVPRWVLSRLRPDPIVVDQPLPNGRKRWWQTVFGG
jgi:hypothetical protein